MKKLIVLLLGAYLSLSAQSASTFFPSQTGFKWHFKVTPFDSLNTPIDSLSFFSVDSFAAVSNYKGLEANYILSKNGGEEINSLPYFDTSFVSFYSTNALVYFKDLFDGLDSLISFQNPLDPFTGWNVVFRFASIANQTYTVFSKDTVLSLDTLEVPIRFEVKGKRLSDQNITTAVGDFTAKRFVITPKVSYLIIPPWPLPVIPVEIFSVDDSIWIASQNWIVKEIVPSAQIDLSFFQLPAVTIPGYKKEIINEIPVSVFEDKILEREYILHQNFPNPFNPYTKINFYLSNEAKINLSVYNMLGEKVDELVNDNLSSGSHSINWIAENFSSGIYYYKLSAGDFVQIKKMILLK